MNPFARKLSFGAALLVAAASVSAIAHASDGGQAGSRFAFLPDFFFDLDSNLEVNDRAIRPNPSMRVCDTAETNCLYGRWFRVAWPMDCIIPVEGQKFHGRGVTTQVVGSYHAPQRHGRKWFYLAATQDHPDALFILDSKARLVGIVQDPRMRGILETENGQAEVADALNQGNRITPSGFRTSYLVGGHLRPCQYASDREADG
ncbi:hypothetical protein AAG612_03005 [Citromicrobium bathyomarinum]|uniref:hypothetical protein n=1 Tax=Citromicrobium bathyomarinum TaxID=72174 RepID=UPI00315B3EF4